MSVTPGQSGPGLIRDPFQGIDSPLDFHGRSVVVSSGVYDVPSRSGLRQVHHGTAGSPIRPVLVLVHSMAVAAPQSTLLVSSDSYSCASEVQAESGDLHGTPAPDFLDRLELVAIL